MKKLNSKKQALEVHPSKQNKIHHLCKDNMFKKYQLQFYFFSAKLINEIINEVRSTNFIHFIQRRHCDHVGEQLRRYYDREESKIRLRNYANYYVAIHDYSRPNFPHLSHSSILTKRKRKFYKLQNRSKNQEEARPLADDQNKSVLKNLNKRTMYLEEIEVDMSNAHRGSLSQVPFDDFKRFDIRDGKAFKNAEVHDVYNPEFSSDDEFNKSWINFKKEKEVGLPKKLNVSIQSREFIDFELKKTKCSQIHDIPHMSESRMVDDFSELISFQHVNKSNSKGNVETSEIFESDSQIIKNTKEKIMHVDINKFHKNENQSDTKPANSINVKLKEKTGKKNRNEKPFFATINWKNKRPVENSKRETTDQKSSLMKPSLEIKKTNPSNYFQPPKVTSQRIKNSKKDQNTDREKNEMHKTENKKDRLIFEFFGTSNSELQNKLKPIQPSPSKPLTPSNKTKSKNTLEKKHIKIEKLDEKDSYSNAEKESSLKKNLAQNNLQRLQEPNTNSNEYVSIEKSYRNTKKNPHF